MAQWMHDLPTSLKKSGTPQVRHQHHHQQQNQKEMAQRRQLYPIHLLLLQMVQLDHGGAAQTDSLGLLLDHDLGTQTQQWVTHLLLIGPPLTSLAVFERCVLEQKPRYDVFSDVCT